MPSQEEYLDQLLKGITEEPIMEEPAAEEVIVEEPMPQEPVFDVPVLEEPVIESLTVAVPDLEVSVAEESDIESLIADTPVENDFVEANTDEDTDILRKMLLENATLEAVLGGDDTDEDDADIMSEDEIERILAANQKVAEFDAASDAVLDADEDLMSLLGESSDGELQDIYDMLHKSDNNEAVDEELFALLQSEEEVGEADKLQAQLDGEADSIEGEGKGLTERQKKAQEKKRLKEEKAAAKQAAKEAKKAEKEAKKAAKKAAKEVAKENEEAAAMPIVAAEDDMIESLDELSTADMLDLQDLLAFADMQSPSESAIVELQQEAKAQSRPVMVDVPEENVSTIDLSEPTAADMQEIDELLNLAGISGLSEDAVVELELADGTSVETLFEENEIRDISSEKEKKGLFARILDFLTETDEDDEDGGTEDIPLSDENRNILEEMDKEEKASGKKGKKGKKDKKGKKGQKAQAELETLDDDEEVAPAPKNKKAAKAKKPKKEKHLEVKPFDEPKRKIPVKVIISIVALCATILVLVLLLANLGSDFAVKREAKKAFYQEDYETCYQTLYGKALNESEQVMFAKSESILRIRLRMRQYEMFVEEKSEVEALDVLIQTVYDYEDLYEYASKWNAGDEVSATYNQMLGILQDKYKLTESDALEIAAEPDDVEYTKLVTAIAGGEGYHSANSESTNPVELPDMLPEEKQFPENNGGQ